MAELSREQTAMLIELYHNHAVLWDSSLKQYKDQRTRNNALEAMQAQFLYMFKIKLEIKDIKTKLQSFRSSFCRELAKMNASMAGDADDHDVYQPTYVHFKDLQFLKSVIKKRSSRWNLEFVSSSQSQDVLTQPVKEELEESEDVWQTSSPPQDHAMEFSWLMKNAANSLHQYKDVDPQEEDKEEEALQNRTPSRPTQQQQRPLTPQLQSRPATPLESAPATSASASPSQYLPGPRPPNPKKRRPPTATDELSVELKKYLQNKRAARKQQKEDPDMIWAKNLIATLNELKNVNAKKIMKIKISGMVNEAALKELEQDTEGN